MVKIQVKIKKKNNTVRLVTVLERVINKNWLYDGNLRKYIYGYTMGIECMHIQCIHSIFLHFLKPKNAHLDRNRLKSFEIV
jgi:hypothetical protein